MNLRFRLRLFGKQQAASPSKTSGRLNRERLITSSVSRRSRLALYGVGIVVVLLFLAIGTTPQATADPSNWVNLIFWGAVLIVLVFFFIRTWAKKPDVMPVQPMPNPVS